MTVPRPVVAQDQGPAPALPRIRAIQHVVLSEVVRLTIEFDEGVAYTAGELTDPPRLFFDLAPAEAIPSLWDATLAFDEGVVRQVRLGRHPDSRTRVVLDLREPADHVVAPGPGGTGLVVEVMPRRETTPRQPDRPDVGISVGVAPAAAGVASQPAGPDGVIELSVLGGPNAFCSPEDRPLSDLSDLFRTQAEDIRTVIRQGFANRDSATVAAILEVLFREAEQFDGAPALYEPDTEGEWMAVRRSGEPGLIGRWRWVGTTPMPGYEITVRASDEVHTFVVPTECCNLALLRSCELPPPPVVDIELCPSCQGSPAVVRARATDAEAALTVSLTGPDGTLRFTGLGQLELTEVLAPGAYTVTAVAQNGCGASAPVTRSFEVPAPTDLEPALDISIAGDDTGNRAHASITAGPLLAKLIIGDTTEPGTDQEKIKQLVASASLEIAMTGPGQDGAPVVLPAGAPTDTGVRWEHGFDLDGPGRYTVTATLRNADGQCEASSSFDFDLPGCVLTVSPPTPAPGGGAQVDLDLCGGTPGDGGSHTVEVRRDGELIRTLALTGCRGTYALETPGVYTFTAVTADDRGVRSTNACTSEVIIEDPPRRVWPFVSAFTGIERRWRDHAKPDLTAGLVGGAGGVMFPVAEHLGLFGRVGGVVNTRESGFSSLFADVGADVLFGNGFLGGGVGIWDFTHSEYRDGSVFFHGGLDLPFRVGRATPQWFVEGRLFLGMLDMIDNNYSGFTGLQLMWKGDREGR